MIETDRSEEKTIRGRRRRFATVGAPRNAPDRIVLRGRKAEAFMRLSPEAIAAIERLEAAQRGAATRLSTIYLD